MGPATEISGRRLSPYLVTTVRHCDRLRLAPWLSAADPALIRQAPARVRAGPRECTTMLHSDDSVAPAHSLVMWGTRVQTDRGTPLTSCPQASADSVYPGAGIAAFTLSLVIVGMLLDATDFQLFRLLIPAVKSAFHLTDTDIALMSGAAFRPLNILTTFALASIADRGKRLQLVGASILVWSVFTPLCAVCTAFWQLLLCRFVVIAAGGGLTSSTLSLIADLYPPKTRGTAIFLCYGLGSLSTGVTFAISGGVISLITEYRSALPALLASLPVWKLALLSAMVPGVALSIVFALTPEPKRVRDQEIALSLDGSISLSRYLRENWATLAWLFAGTMMSSVALGALINWMPIVLNRSHGLSLARSGEYFGVALSAAAGAGIALAMLLDRASRRKLAPLRAMSVCASIEALALIALAVTRELNEIIAVIFVFFVASYLRGFLSPRVLVSIAPNSVRGRISVMENASVSTGFSVMSIAIGMLSDRVFHGANGLGTSLLSVVIPCQIAGAVLMWIVTCRFDVLMQARSVAA